MFHLDIDQNLKLMLVQPWFAPVYFEIVNTQRDYLSQWLPWVRHANSEQFFLDFIKKCQHDYQAGQSLVCGILYQEQLIGNLSFNAIRPQLKRVEIGYWLSQNYQGMGIMTKSVQTLIHYAFDQLHIEKAQISVAVDNQPSRQICERLGMTLEGILSHNENVNGRILDHAIYALHHPSAQHRFHHD